MEKISTKGVKKVGSRGDKAELELSGRNTTVVGGGRLPARDYVRSILSLNQAGPSEEREQLIWLLALKKKTKYKTSRNANDFGGLGPAMDIFRLQ